MYIYGKSCSFSQSGRCPAAQLASIRQTSRQVSRGSAGDFQADEQAGVACVFWTLGEGEGGMIWENGIETCKISYVK